MSLVDVANYLRGKTCNTHRRFGSCDCSSGMGNPCSVTAELASACEQGERLGEVIQRLASRKCRWKFCHHHGCKTVDQAIESLEDIIRRREAAA